MRSELYATYYETSTLVTNDEDVRKRTLKGDVVWIDVFFRILNRIKLLLNLSI